MEKQITLRTQDLLIKQESSQQNQERQISPKLKMEIVHYKRLQEGKE